jgi:hypothetical protein
MRYILSVTASAAVTFFLVQSATATKAERSYQAGYEAGLSQRANVNLDNACTAWFFDTNIKAAKARMCGKRT